MSKTTLVSIIIGILIIAGGATYFLGNSDDQGASVGDAQTKMSLKSLIASGKDQTCTFTDDSNVAASNGTSYFSGGKMRGDFTSTPKETGIEVKSHMIIDGQTAYVWTDQAPQGFKMSLESIENPTGDTSKNNVDVNHEYAYNCEPGTPEQSLFELPKNITFSDMSTLMQGLPQTNTSVKSGTSVPKTSTGNAPQCAQCDLIPDAEGKAQCKQLLGCK